MKSLLIIILSLIVLSTGCGIEDNPTGNNNQFIDRLTLGKGLGGNGFQLVEETTTFSDSSAPIFFKLESKADFEGAPISLRIEKKINGVYSFLKDFGYNNPQSNGHVFLSSFTLNERGEFKAIGINSYTSIRIASIEFVIN
ncbi:MAG: hypothetical protein HXY49_10545 [Ignavibacteriaceae bacterium]|nr:hypothetical protein [Ignavibacteriaceae bacterium]